jgi:PiT family inorganic phosphate transporter
MAAETGAAVALFGSTALGAPVSTTHTVAGAVTGVGVAIRGAPVNWTVFGQMALAWVFTIPAAALASAAVFAATQLSSHVLAGILLALLGAALTWTLAVGLQSTTRGAHLEGEGAASEPRPVPAS